MVKYKILHIVGGMGKGGTETMLMNVYKKIDRNKVQFDFYTLLMKKLIMIKKLKN